MVRQKVRCQRGEQKIERNRTKQEREAGENRSKRQRRGERLRAGSVGGWVGGFGNVEWTFCLSLLVKQRHDFYSASAHSPSGISCKNSARLRSIWNQVTPNRQQFFTEKQQIGDNSRVCMCVYSTHWQ